MKKIMLYILVGIVVLTITGCGNERTNDSDNLYIDDNVSVNNDECCEGCMCGDSIELLKTTETAWDLSKIKDNGDYEQIKDAFINFHGTGKNKFAFFKNNEEVKGEFLINNNNEIILIPSNNNRITCKLGEEKNLIAVLECDSNFGTFTLQKEGKLELSSVFRNRISKTKYIKVINNQTNKGKKIKDENEIDVITSIINNSKIWTGAVTLPSPKYELELFDDNNRNIAKILYNPGHYFTIELDDKSYNLTNIDHDALNPILSK